MRQGRRRLARGTPTNECGAAPKHGPAPRWSALVGGAHVPVDATAAVVVEVVAEQRLYGVVRAADRDDRRRALAAGDPGADVAVLRAAAVEPAAGRVRVGDRLGVLVPADDRHAFGGRVDAGAPGRDEVRAAGRARVADVRQVR